MAISRQETAHFCSGNKILPIKTTSSSVIHNYVQSETKGSPPARAKYRRAVYFMYPPQSYAMKYMLYYKGKSNVTFNLRSRREIDIS